MIIHEPKRKQGVQSQNSRTMIVRIIIFFLLGMAGIAHGQMASSKRTIGKNEVQTSSIDTYLKLRKSLWSGPEKELSNKDKTQLTLFLAANNTGSFEYHYLSFINSGDPVLAKKHLETAEAKSPQNKLLFLPWIDYAVVTGNASLLADYAKKVKSQKLFDDRLMDYTRDVLRGLPQGAFLVVNGQDDTYPIYALQHAEGLRKDVTVVQLDLYGSAEYRNILAKKLGIAPSSLSGTSRTQFYTSIAELMGTKPISFAFTLPPAWLKKISTTTVTGGLYLCAPQFSNAGTRSEVFGVINQHPKGDYAMNYLPFLFFLHQEASYNNTGLANQCSAMIVEIAKQTSREQEILQQLRP